MRKRVTDEGKIYNEFMQKADAEVEYQKKVIKNKIKQVLQIEKDDFNSISGKEMTIELGESLRNQMKHLLRKLDDILE
jgi:hypothetical protein